MREVVPDVKTAPRVVVNGKAIFFCCKACPGKFRQHPEQYVGATVRDPVSGKAFHPSVKSPRVEQPGKLFLFESAATRAQFLRKKGPSGKMAPVSGR
jgi:YHS domain-containing protein